MKVVIEGSTLFTKGYTGIPHYILSLQKALKNKDNVDVELAYNIKKIAKLKNNKSKLPFVWYFKFFIFSFKKKPLISHSLHTPFLKINGTKKIATIHDLAVHLPMFENYNFSSEYFKNKRLKLFKEFYDQADAIIAVSENTKQDFLKFFNYPANKIHVVYLAPVFKPKEVSEITSKNKLIEFGINANNYYLTVGGVSLRKNSLNLLKGFYESGKHKEHKIVFAGKIIASEKEKLDAFILDKKLTNQIVFTNYISDDVLSILYKNAKAFLFPTFYEGFGIPIIEAMRYKLPVLTSTSGAAPEIANKNAILVNPFEEKSIAEGILKIDGVSQHQIEKAYEYSAKFTWDKVAKDTIKVYKSVLG